MEEKTVRIGTFHELKFTCEDFDENGLWQDTGVWFDDGYLMHIQGADIESFTRVFTDMYYDFAI